MCWQRKMAGIKFNDYIVSKLSYEENENFNNETNELNATTSFEALISINKTEAKVTIISQTGDLANEDSPFQVIIELTGFFEFIEDESAGVEFEEYLQSNAIAILFPYMRAIVSDVITKANNFPTLILPVANIAKMMEDQGKITIERDVEDK